MNKLVIVESPTKAKTLSKFLGKEYKVESSKGHIRDLPKKELGVDVEHDFTPSYVVMPGKNKVVSTLKKVAKDASEIYLATDLDREGEAIAYHLAEVIGSNAKLPPPSRLRRAGKTQNSRLRRDFGGQAKLKNEFKRVIFHEITESAIKESFTHPRGLDFDLFDAYQARRVLDRLVGYKLSPLLWKKIRYGLSAGRVQSVTVRLIVEREREREKFKSEKYWTIEAELTKFMESRRVPHFADRGATKIAKNSHSPLYPRSVPADDTKISTNSHSGPADVHGMGTSPASFLAQLIAKDDKPYEITTEIPLFVGEYQSKKTSIASKRKADEIIHDIKNYNFIVSEIEKKEVKRNPYPPFTTASLQRTAANYLGFSAKRTMRAAQSLYEEGFITYHRTDSLNLAEEFLVKCREYLKKEFGEQFVPETANRYQTKVKSAQEAHEAIRPTDVGLQIQNAKLKIKNLGRDEERLYGLIWKRALASQMTPAVFDQVRVDIMAGSYLFRATGRTVKFLGWMIINKMSNVKSQMSNAEEGGGGEGEKSIPKLEVGEKVKLVKLIPSEHTTQSPPRYTEASLIHDLEKYGIGRPSTYAPIISTIQERNYVTKEERYFRPEDIGIVVNDLLVEHFPEIVDLQFTAKMEDDLDEIAQGQKKWVPVVQEFYTPFEEKLEQKSQELKREDLTVLEETSEKCPDCGKPLIVKLSRYGKFLSCSGFPKCKFAKPFLEKIGMRCPKCGKGEVIVRRTKRGKTFYGCSEYPKCEWASWKNPKKISKI